MDTLVTGCQRSFSRTCSVTWREGGVSWCKGLGRKQVVVSKGKGAFPSWESFSSHCTIIDCVSDVSNTGLLD